MSYREKSANRRKSGSCTISQPLTRPARTPVPDYRVINQPEGPNEDEDRHCVRLFWRKPAVA